MSGEPVRSRLQQLSTSCCAAMTAALLLSDKTTIKRSTILIALMLMLTVNGVRAQQPAATPTPTPANTGEPPGANIIQSNLHFSNNERRAEGDYSSSQELF